MDVITRAKRAYGDSSFWQSRKPEYAAFALFVLSFCVVTAFHEPWFDEAQAWQIGKCASLYELLFEIPHYEGHPAFWSLLLAIPAKLGAPFELSLKLIGLLITAASVYVILFKMPFPRLMRLLVPFTYFVFYQFGVIVRPYGLMTLLFLLLSLAFPVRHEKPWRFVCLLMLLCLTGAYAIVMAGGIASCYLWEIIREKGVKGFFAGLFSDPRSYALLALLLLAILLILEIMPRENTYATSTVHTGNSFLACLAVTLFTLPGECTLTTGSWFMQDQVLLKWVHLNSAEIVAFSLLGILLWIVLISVSSKQLLKHLVVPYGFFAVFAAYVYFSVHHIGIVYAFLLFWLGIVFRDPERFEIGRAWRASLAQTERDKALLTRAVAIVGLACLLIPVYWNAAACVLDVQKEYSSGRTVAKWIKAHDLEDSLILNVWGEVVPEDGLPEEEARLTANTYMVGMPVDISAYFDHNICMNLNFGRDDEAYMHYRIATREENRAALQQWAASGIPDVLLQKPRLQDIYGDSVSYDDYCVVLILPEHRIWKNHSLPSYTPVYARKDILAEHGLSPIQDEGFEYYINGFTITEEMKEQYENGVPVEEILKPYLDAIFGEE